MSSAPIRTLDTPSINIVIYFLQELELGSKRQAEEIPKASGTIAVETHEVNIVGAQLIEERDALDALAPVVRNVKLESLAQG